jgi:hypothetical protein
MAKARIRIRFRNSFVSSDQTCVSAIVYHCWFLKSRHEKVKVQYLRILVQCTEPYIHTLHF